MDGNLFDRMTRWLAGTASRRTALRAATAGMTMPRASDVRALQATSESTPESTQKPVFMFVQTALLGRAEVNPHAGTPTVEGSPVAGGGASYLLTLEGHSGQTIYFSDRPDRIVGAIPTADFLNGLGFTPDNPPNAALVAEFTAGDGVAVLQLVSPVYDAETGTLTYGVEGLRTYAGENLEPVTRDQVVERLPAEFEHAALFIDDCPNYTSCSVEVCGAVINTQGDRREICWLEVAGPIPGGPYKSCFTKDASICMPCDATLDKLTVLCDAAYPAACEERCVPS